METRANFILIGAFTLGAVVAAFLFIMWIVGYGASGTNRRYQIIFNGSVSGLSPGATVLFNGLKVGEVTRLGFVKGNPSQVVADINVTNESAPINSDTKAQLETQGLTGSATVALIGGETGKGELTGNPPIIPSLPTATLADLQTKAGYVLDLANKILVDNALPLHQTLENVQTFSMALSSNSGGVDAALKGLADLGKTIQPLATRLQALSEDADALLKSVDKDQIRSFVDNVAGASAKANALLDQVNKLVADNSGAVDKTLGNVSAFSQTLADNRSNIDATLKGLADLGKQIGPVAQNLQNVSADADKLIKAIDTDKLRGVVDNVNTFSEALAASADDYKSALRDGAAFISKLNQSSQQLDSAISNIGRIAEAVDPKKVSGIVDAISGVADTVGQNRGNIDQAIKNAAEMTAKLNESADKIDGLIASAQSFLGSPGTKSALGQIGDAAQSVKKLADDLDVRVKEIAAGLSRFSNSGLRQYEALAIQGQRVLEDIDQTVRSFKQNPSQLIWGAKPSLPQYRAGQ